MKNKLLPFMLLVLCLASFPFAAGAESDSRALLAAIDQLAQQGWILNCDCRVGQDTIDKVTDKLGQPDQTNYAPSAKGTYATFKSVDIVAGFNKGEQIFELRSTDTRLGAITLQDVESYFGQPDHAANSNGERYVSYKLTDEINLKFVFPDGETNPVLSHYNVLWPQGTANLMADDEGRIW